MKFILTILFSSFVFCSVYAQVIIQDDASGKYQAEGIIVLDSLKKDVIFTKAKEWITLNYKSAKDVIQLADKESSKIIIKGSFPTNVFMKSGWILHTLILDFKDGKMRYSYSDFVYDSSGSGPVEFESKSLGFKKKLIKETDSDVESSIQNLKEYIDKNSKKKDDW